jgi:beta-xylosidase
MVIGLVLLTTAMLSFGQRLVMPGDHPDPSVTKIGNYYWASATTSNWFPAFPLLRSKDLIHWESKGYVFDKKPEWADYYFWAPELSYENGKVYVYYAAHKKNGNLCVGIASADKPEGPYHDHGPLVCQEDGSIDAFPMRDKNGKLYLVWKEDANSIGRPTPIWIQEINEQRTALIGDKKELFRNDAKWEGNLVEGVSMIRHGDYYYAFYAAAGCCGVACTYSVGVARAKDLLGPWEKYDKNPIMINSQKWVCPGHGTPVEKDGRYYFLYHSYDKSTNAFTGRQGILREFTFTPDHWVEFVKENDTASRTTAADLRDEFNSHKLSDAWQWSVFQNINYSMKEGSLQLGASPDLTGAFIGQKILSGDYNASTVIRKKSTTALAGLADIGDEKNMIAAFYHNNRIEVVQIKDGKDSSITAIPVFVKNKLHLRMQVRNAKEITFAYSIDGKKYTVLNQKPLDGGFLPPWDRAVRTGLVAKGQKGQVAVFDKFEMVSRRSDDTKLLSNK